MTMLLKNFKEGWTDIKDSPHISLECRLTNVLGMPTLFIVTSENGPATQEVTEWAVKSLRLYLQKRGFQFLRTTVISSSANSTSTTQESKVFFRLTSKKNSLIKECLVICSVARGTSLVSTPIVITHQSFETLILTSRKVPLATTMAQV